MGLEEDVEGGTIWGMRENSYYRFMCLLYVV
jgi:hypothetical protein